MQSTLHKLFPFVDFVYILQLEDYNSRNYLKWIQSRLFKRGFQKVARIDWTHKATLIFALTMFLYLILSIQLSTLIPVWWWEVLILIITTALIPYIVLIANLLFTPIDIFAKRQALEKAKQKLSKMSHLKIVAVVGSQGKTSTRYFITQLLEGSIEYYSPPKNYNVGLSIARDIIGNLTSKCKVYVVEFGELYKGDLTYLDAFLHPDKIVLTSISSQHIAQFGSQDAIDAEFLSLLNSTKAELLINGDDAGVKRIRPLITQKYETYHTFTLDNYYKKQHLPEILHMDHMQQNASAAAKIAEWLDVSHEAIEKKLESLQPIERRLHTVKQNEITIIDDSYNISPESATEALNHLSTHHGRKIVVTGGIVDQGDRESFANRQFGNHIAKVADVAIISANRLGQYVINGIEQENNRVQILTSSHPDSTPQLLQKILQKGDVVLVQNELPDLYWS